MVYTVFHFEDDLGRFTMRDPPLRRALVDLQYPLSPRLVGNEGLTELQELLRPDFPLMRAVGAPSFTISFGPAPASSSFTERYQFESQSGFDLIVGTSNATLSLAGQAYGERARLAALLERVATAVGAVGRITQCLRIGVRYINSAPATTSDWAAWFKAPFVGWTETTTIVDQRVNRVHMSITQLSLPDSDIVTAATIRHGYLPEGIGQDLGGDAKEPAFLVDIDMASDVPTAFDAVGLVALFLRINGEIARYFRYTFTAAGEERFGLEARKEEGNAIS